MARAEMMGRLKKMRGAAGGLTLSSWQTREWTGDRGSHSIIYKEGIAMLELKVGGMGCGSCVARIINAVKALDAEARVNVDRAAGRVTVDTGASADAVCAALGALGYPAAPVAAAPDLSRTA
jgi:copper chaperone